MSHLSVRELSKSNYVSVVATDTDYIRWLIDVPTDEGYTHIAIDHESGSYMLALRNQDGTNEYVDVRNPDSFLIAFEPGDIIL